MQGGRGPMYGYGMMPQYGSFQQPSFAANGQIFPGTNNQTMGQSLMGQVIRPSTTTSTSSRASSGMGGATTTASSKTPQAQFPGRSKTPTPVAQPVNTPTQRPAQYTDSVRANQHSQRVPVQHANQHSQGVPVLGNVSQRPTTTNKIGQNGIANKPPVQVPHGGSASALAPTQQTQATPLSMGAQNNGGRQHWALELWVVRHGETIENNTRVIAGQNGSGLTEHGQEQAYLLGQRLQNVNFAGIYISDLNRTKQTADAVLRAMGPGTPAFTDSRLREKGAGSYEGYKIGYIEQMTRQSGQAHRVFRPPGGESWEDVAQRSRSFMREVLARYCTSTEQQGRPLSHRGYDTSGRAIPVSAGYNPGQNNAHGETKRILIVTHGGFISEFLSSAVGGVPNCAKNCSIFVLCCARDHPQGRAQFWLKTINEVAHLEPLTAKGMVQSGPETVTETVTNPGMIDEDDDDKRTEDLLCSNSSTVHTAAPELVKSPVGSPNTTVGIVAPGSRSPMGTPLVVPAPRSPMDNTRSPPRSPPSATVARVDDPRPMAEVERKVADLKVADLKVADLNLSPSAQPDINGPQANGAVTGLVTAFPHRTPTTPSVHMRHATMPDSTRPQYLAMPGAVHQMHSHNQMHSNNFSAPRPAIQTHNGIAMSPQLKGKDVSAPSVEHVQC